MPTIDLTDAQYREVRSLVRNEINAAYEEARDLGRRLASEDRATLWEHSAMLAGILAAFARAEEVHCGPEV